MSGVAGDEPAPTSAATEVDARGQRCPLPVIALAMAAGTLAGGSEIVVLATDPATRHDVPAWCRMRGHTVVSAPPPAIKEFPASDQGIRGTPHAPADELRFVVRLGRDAGTSETR